MSEANWPRVVAIGALWALVYNLLWGLAWFTFMRTEWREAFAAIGRPQEFTAEVWIVWGALSVPIGAAIMAHAATQERAPKTAVAAAATAWLPLTLGMASWAIPESLPIRTVVLDSTVNLVAMIAASLAGGRVQATHFLLGKQAQRSRTSLGGGPGSS